MVLNQTRSTPIAPSQGDPVMKPEMKNGTLNRNSDSGSRPTATWILVADSKRARLLRGERTPQSRPHLEEAASLESSWVDHDRGRPNVLASKSPRPLASRGHEEEEEIRHFARELAAWLERQLAAHQIAECTVFAPARFLGALRKEIPSRVHGSLTEHSGELTHLSAGELARHPAIAGRLAP
jgi:protein required for attachment to host cells